MNASSQRGWHFRMAALGLVLVVGGTATISTGCSRSEPEPAAGTIPVIPPGRGAEPRGISGPGSVPNPERPPAGMSRSPSMDGVKDPLNPVPPPPLPKRDAKTRQ